MIKLLARAQNYKQFLNQMLENPLFGRGAKTRLAEHLKVQGSFISLVLSGTQDFSADHAIKIAEFLKLDAPETETFMTMLLRDRAGTAALREYYQKMLERLIAAHADKVHIKAGKQIEAEEQDLALYYGSWTHTAVHMAIHHPKYRTVAALMEKTKLKEAQVRESIDLLVRVGFAQFDRDRVVPAERRFHLGKNSLALRSHHINWRNQVVRSLDEVQPEALHYSLVMNVDAETARKMRDLLREAIQKADLHLERAKPGNVYSLCVDLFEVF